MTKIMPYRIRFELIIILIIWFPLFNIFPEIYKDWYIAWHKWPHKITKVKNE